MSTRYWKRCIAGVLAGGAALTCGVAAATGSFDFGAFRDGQLASKSEQLYGIGKPVAASSTLAVDAATASADPTKLVTLAKGLKAKVVTSGVAPPNVDQITLWPNDTNPTYLIACNEQGTTAPGLVRINIQTGASSTILTGTTACDPTRLTPWGTLLFGEEAGASGQMFELKDPLTTNNVVYDRVAGTFSGADAANVVRRDSLGRLSFEGLAIYPNGVTYYGDENRPANGTPGGAYFKYVPTTPWSGGTLTDLSQSPFASGSVSGLRLGKLVSGANTDYGQGTQIGRGTWVPVCSDGTATPCNDPDLRAFTAANKLTGYYRPEDLSVDPAALANGQSVKSCGPNTGNEGTDHNWGEVICITDGNLSAATAGTATPEVQYFVLGSSDLAMLDNIAYQNGARGNWVLHEDGDIDITGKNNDLWDCLPDGSDADTQSDGCIRIGTLNDRPVNAPGFNPEGAEWTGGIFDATGTHFYVSIQHNVTGKAVVLDITGWK
ncbi:MAG: hypothetical protein JWL83_3267 [Actinomycetia bacterium]|nr:hypothetical protein [Actinomycetes bacterium]